MPSDYIYFVSRDAKWQKYRCDILTKIAKINNTKIIILTTGNIKKYLKDNEYLVYKVFKSWLPLWWKPSLFPGAVSYILKNRPKSVLCINNVTQVTEYITLLACKLFGIRFIWWTHGYDHGSPDRNFFLKQLKEKYFLFFLEKADAIITFSEKGTSYLVKKGINPQKIFTAPNTLDTNNLLKKREILCFRKNKLDLMTELGLNPKDTIILFSGRLNQEKKLEDAINSLAIVVHKLPDVKLYIIGAGEQKNILVQLAKKIAPNNVIFLGEIFDDNLLAKWFSVSSLFIMPGAVGLAIVQAFCFGLPIITERLKIHGPEIQYLHEGYNGFFVDEGDVEDLARRIMELLGDRDKLSSFSKNALLTAKTEANVQNMIEMMSKSLGFV